MLYVVIEDAGEYEQRWRRPIGVFTDEAKAKLAIEGRQAEQKGKRRSPPDYEIEEVGDLDSGLLPSW